MARGSPVSGIVFGVWREAGCRVGVGGAFVGLRDGMKWAWSVHCIDGMVA